MSELLKESRLLREAIRSEIALAAAVTHDQVEVAQETSDAAWKAYDRHVWALWYAE